MMTNDDLSKGMDEAANRAAIGDRIAVLEAQRDELALCLREIMEGFSDGRFVADVNNPKVWQRGLRNYALLLTRSKAALLRLDVRERLEDRLAAERKGEA